jgi:Glycosyltransferase WbsX
MFSPQAFDPEDLIFNNRNFYGLDRDHDPWMGVRDLHEHLPIQQQNIPQTFQDWWNLDWSHLKPEIGYYDQSDVSTLEKHIQQASENGLTYFNFYWYWHHYLNKESINDGLDSFLKAANSNKMQFTLSICAHGWYWTIARSQVSNVVELIVQKYLKKDNYLKTLTGQPIVTICDPKGIWDKQPEDEPIPPTPIDWDSVNFFLNELRSRTYAELGKYPVLLGRADEKSYEELIQYVEGGSCVLSFTPNQNYQDSAQNTAKRLTELKFSKTLKLSKSLMPCVSQNMDTRPRMGVRVTEPDLEQLFNLKEYSAEGFRTALEQAKIWMDTQTDELSQYLSIYAWNEWHEGGIIEPNSRDSAQLLNIINKVFALKNG